MTLFQHVAVWSLRFLLVWGAFEAGMSLYGEAVSQMEKLGEIRGHEAAMKRLDERARESERALGAEQARLASVQRVVWSAPAPAVVTRQLSAAARPSSSPGEAIAAALRGDLMEFGASEVMLETAEAPLSREFIRVAIDARWREPIGQSPSILDRLGPRRTNVSLVEISMERPDGAQSVRAAAKLEAIVRAPRAPSRVAGRAGATPLRRGKERQQ